MLHRELRRPEQTLDLPDALDLQLSAVGRPFSLISELNKPVQRALSRLSSRRTEIAAWLGLHEEKIHTSVLSCKQ